jgi:protein-disulfide isomerase
MYSRFGFCLAVTLLIALPCHAQKQGSTATGGKSKKMSQTAKASASPLGKAAEDGAQQSSAGKLTILEFGDLQCPDTAAFASGGRQQMLRDFVQGGKASYSFHDFPLDAHPLAPLAAEIARCAGGKNTDRARDQMLTQQSQATSEQALLAQAQSLGGNAAGVQQCIESGTSRQAVQQDRALGQSYGVRATPSLVLGITGADGKFLKQKVIRADRPYEQVRADIESLMTTAPGQ